MKKYPLIYRLSIITGLLLLCLSTFLKIGLHNAKASLSTYTYPYTSVLNVDLGNKSIHQAEIEVKKLVQNYMSNPVKIIYENKKYEILPEDLGVISPEADILSAIKIIDKNSSDYDFIKNYFSNHQIDIVVQIDKNKFHKKLHEVFPQAFIPYQNAFYQKENNQIIVIPENAGKTIDFEFISNKLNNSINQLTPIEIKIDPVIVNPTIYASDLQLHKDEAAKALLKKITLKLGLKKITLIFKNHPEWFTVIDNKLVLNQTAFINWFNEELRADFESEKADVSIKMDEEGKITFEGFGKRGIKIQDSNFVQAINAILLNEETIVEIPVNYSYPQVTVTDDLKEKGIKELIAVGYSDFRGSTNTRIFNVKVGLDKFNGVIIGPGETFSFVDILGPVNGATGYKKELVIKQNETKPDYGGGLCQVSSTAFRAALWAGFPIVERSPHTYAVSYYARPGGQGLDATIYPGSKDLKFLNDTPGHILFQTHTEGTLAFYNIYGISDGRKVEINNYKTWGWVGAPATIIEETTALAPGKKRIVEQASQGFKASWDRIITKNGETNKETILSTYKPWAKKILVGIEASAEESENTE